MMIPIYSLEQLQSNGAKIHEVYSFPDTYYVITYTAQNQLTSYWKIDKQTKKMTVSSWPEMIIETKGAVNDDLYIYPKDKFLKEIGLV